MIARDIECPGYESFPAPETATDAGTCTSFYSGTVSIFYFDENSARDDFVARGLAEEQEPHTYLVGNHFAIDGSPMTLIETRQVIDGEYRD